MKIIKELYPLVSNAYCRMHRAKLKQKTLKLYIQHIYRYITRSFEYSKKFDLNLEPRVIKI